MQSGTTPYRPSPPPLDAEGFVKSFSLGDLDGAAASFDELGFVVIDGVLSEAERMDTINDIWAVIEGFCGGKLGIHRDDPRSWRQRWPGGGPGLLGQALSPAAWLNRANPSLRAAFERIVGQADLLCSVDNYGVLRPTRRVPMHQLPPQTPSRTDVTTTGAAEAAAAEPQPLKDMEAWKTKSKWLHWDLSPFHWVAGTMPPYTFTPYSFISENNGTALEPGARCRVQGLLNLIDARTEDGGFLCVPGFHKHLLEWAAAAENQPYKEETVDAFDFLEVPKDDPMQAWAQPVPMRAGSLLIWNSELPHCNYANDSDRFRMVQYVKCFPRPPPTAAAGGGGAARSGFLTQEKTREQLVAAWVGGSLGAEREAALTADQRAILGLPNGSPAPEPEPSTPSR